MFTTVLIANRGEIACRIIRTLRSLGIRSVAVYSDADAGARHVRLADASVRLGPAPAAQSYLDAEAVIAAARATGAEAVHPGYGFLAENAAFARACEEAGLVFIGPTAESIRVMGDKITAKNAVHERGVPTVPGIARPGLTNEELAAAAGDVGYPLLIKPSAGGGGKGMHVVEAPDRLHAALEAARREAAASFGDDTLFLERYVTTPRHIEVQVLADAHGNVIHLGERECSLQRRHQKVIEEAPSPLLDEATRARIGRAACDTARSVDYRGAGTVEFIVPADAPDEFFFMEMNTRLQVEHPVTEQVTGVDLVEQQLRIAAGEPLALAQEDVVLDGHSIEARVYAEDPAAGFLPTGGTVEHVRHPAADGVRVDTALEDGLVVSVDYDPMLAKVITWGRDREEARRRLVAALEDTAVVGFTTNVEFLRALLRLPDVVAGDLDTGLIARELDGLAAATPTERDFREAALLMDAARGTAAGPWHRRDGWRLGEAAPRRIRLVAADGTRATVRLAGSVEAPRVLTEDGELPARVRRDGHWATVTLDGVGRGFTAVVGPEGVQLAREGALFDIRRERADHGVDAEASSDPTLVSPMPGTVLLAPVADGDAVAEGDPVVVVEAMKMEHVIRSTVAGTVRLHAAVGDAVARGQVLAVITPAGASDDGAPEGAAGGTIGGPDGRGIPDERDQHDQHEEGSAA
ncbi:acetyl-CoA carboxylase biotin carboxylase subunit [Citricoccus sp. SGAir0253]|uniref:acetyl-CoA carboxylase biotin carboxylase subunit n=1 Tax=Citricoccus sp. SGAir0253 TaxID=2567881 RepID=UPI0010CCC1B5|nr:acetyl-CoA carboxylase biotin carboxylase subunit [Citricoccus sp. SGAir0253]QCU79002.1 acetyl-CoA carboxylase biotin carboxylase subunit [Citricoccus sp. SGAir0253]